MAVDRYTKTVLTVIALALLWLCFRAVPEPATAKEEVQRVEIVAISQLAQPVKVNIEEIRGRGFFYGGGLPVRGEGPVGAPVPVKIVK